MSVTNEVKTVEGAKTSIPVRIGHYRWTICALLFFATTINYIDRQVIGLLKNDLMRDLHWDQIDYSNVVFFFQLAYAMGLLGFGKVIDWLGTRKGFSFALIFWSVAAMAHAAASSVFTFGAARFALGLGESGNFPACIKTVAEWFPKKERALATGVFNSGTNVGALITPPAVWLIISTLGWRWAFIITGAVGFLWVIFWLAMYQRPEKHPKLSKAELEYIMSDPPDPIKPIPWLRLFPYKETWAFFIGKFMTDPIWWFYLFWLPGFLKEKHNLELSQAWVPLIVVYSIASFGAIGGGWISSALLKRGWSVNAARKTAMLICALCVVPSFFASQTQSAWGAILLVSLGCACHQGWSSNIFSTASDMFPRSAVGSVVGIGGMGGAVGGMLIAKVTGYVLQWTNSYVPMFATAASVYLLALLIMHLMVPRIEQVRIAGEPQ